MSISSSLALSGLALPSSGTSFLAVTLGLYTGAATWSYQALTLQLQLQPGDQCLVLLDARPTRGHDGLRPGKLEGEAHHHRSPGRPGGRGLRDLALELPQSLLVVDHLEGLGLDIRTHRTACPRLRLRLLPPPCCLAAATVPVARRLRRTAAHVGGRSDPLAVLFALVHLLDFLAICLHHDGGPGFSHSPRGCGGRKAVARHGAPEPLAKVCHHLAVLLVPHLLLAVLVQKILQPLRLAAECLRCRLGSIFVLAHDHKAGDVELPAHLLASLPGERLRCNNRCSIIVLTRAN
mmetsp:Transcript_109321/g.352945  ORF Transcript_109321/g.352945 Transcript_109321/m.352945 type:complete len:292 (-) Transcript_109321:1572-2447(-)